MTVYSVPSGFPSPSRVQLRIMPSVRTFTSPYSMQVQAVDLMSEVWRMQLDLPATNSKITAGAVEALFDRLKGQANQIALWHFGRKAPLGTMRGTPTLSASAAQWANTVSISGSGTLLAGDMIGIGGQLCRVMADASSLSSVEIAPRLRTAMSSGTTVTWDKPTANFILAADGPAVDYLPGMQAGITAEFIEAV